MVNYFKIGIDFSSLFFKIFIPFSIFVLTIILNKKWQKAVLNRFNSIITIIKSKQKDESEYSDEHAKLIDNKGLFEIDLYWGERSRAFNEMREGLINIRNDIFVSGIALRTILDRMLEDDVISHLKHKIEKPHSSFKITIIACDSVESAQRPERDKLKESIAEGKKKLDDFRNKLNNAISPTRREEEADRPFLIINTYPLDIAPRHFISLLDNFIYVGSYLNNKDGFKSYIMRLKEFEGISIDQNKHIGLYELFQSEIKYLKKHCVEKYTF